MAKPLPSPAWKSTAGNSLPITLGDNQPSDIPKRGIFYFGLTVSAQLLDTL